MTFLAGHEDYDSIRPVSYKGAHAFFVMFSVVSPHSFNNAKSKWVDEIEHHVPGAPFVLVGTKCDLREDAPTLEKLKGQKPISEEQGREAAKELDALAYVETSALKQQGLLDPFAIAVKAIVDERRREADELKEAEAAQTTQKKQGKSSSGGFFSKKKK